MTDQYTGDGGSAFPVPGLHNDADFNGMSLRDFFAAKAMPHFYNRCMDGGFERVARLSYEMADAMLRARKVAP